MPLPPNTSSPTVEEPTEADEIKLTEDEQKHVSFIMRRLMVARDSRDQKHPELNNKTFVEYYEDNERIANTFVPGKKFDGDVKIASGTVEQKMLAVLAEINRLNLTSEVRAFDKDDTELVSLGMGMTDVLFKMGKQDGDEEKKLMRQLELLKQGSVFIQELWSKEYKKDKKYDKSQIGKVKGVDWTEKLEKVFEGPRRSILYAPAVYMGNVRMFDVKKQPYIFTTKLSSYDEVKSRYGNTNTDGKDVWERWHNVSKKRVQILNEQTFNSNSANNAWALTEFGEDLVEEVHYQDYFNNEYQIFLNGVPMLPVGFPLSAISPGGEYNIEKQVLQAINPFFAYGRSFTVKVKEQSDILDEMLRLLILKTRKSIHPPYANVSNKVISQRVLMPGRITTGIDPQSLQAIGQEGQGATASEYQMFKILQENINSQTVSEQFTGQPGKAGTTAFEVATLQQQAQKLISLIIFAQIMMEKKIEHMRLLVVLENYFDPVDTRVNDAKTKIINTYRVASRKTDLEGQGEGIRTITPTEELPTSQEIRESELFEGTPEAEAGNKRRKTRAQVGLPPMKKIFINVKELRKIPVTWYVEVDSKPRDTSSTAKLLFREELGDIAALTEFGSVPKVAELEATYSQIWGRRKDRVFQSGNGDKLNPALAEAVQKGGVSLGGTDNKSKVNTTTGPEV